ncbi:MAG: PAS domain S-box protein [Longimicrobiales bacterium]
MPKTTNGSEPGPGPAGYNGVEERVLVLAPFGSDATILRRVLSSEGMGWEICGDMDELVEQIGRGAGALLVAEEALSVEGRDRLAPVLLEQEPWSDLPLLILLSAGAGNSRNELSLRRVDGTTHLTFLERPLGIAPFVSAVRTAVESRKKQYGIRDELAARQEARQALRRVNEELEERIRERTARLAASEMKYRVLVENTLDIPFGLSAAGEIRYAGPQVRRYGFDPEKLKGLRFLQVVHGGDRRRVASAFRKMLKEEVPTPLEFRIRASDGTLYWMEEKGLFLRDESGEIAGFTGVLRDVTARRREADLRARREDRLRQLSARMASAQDLEQRRIAQGLHDDVAQLLTACSIKNVLAESTRDEDIRRALHKEMEELLDQAARKVQSLSFELYSSTLRRLGLREALEELCDSMTRRYGIRFEFESEGEMGPLDKDTQTVLFKIARELLFNVVKHAGVAEARVILYRGDESLRLEVEDRGVGLPPGWNEEEVGLGRGLGLFGIRERIQDIGGEMRIRSAPGDGTRVSIVVPAPGGGLQD